MKPILVNQDVLFEILDHIHQHITNVHDEGDMILYEHIRASIHQDAQVTASTIFLAICEWRHLDKETE